MTAPMTDARIDEILTTLGLACGPMWDSHAAIGARLQLVDDVPDLIAEVKRLRAIIEGRTTPPSTEEKRAIRAAGGSTRYEWGEDCVERWWHHDSLGRPCAWPTVTEVSRG